MNAPSILGRMEDDTYIDARASTKLLHSVDVPFEAGAVGNVTVSVFKSVDEEDRGGLVFRITLNDQAQSFIPHAVSINNGIELHMAGGIEAKSLVQAIKKLVEGM